MDSEDAAPASAEEQLAVTSPVTEDEQKTVSAEAPPAAEPMDIEPTPECAQTGASGSALLSQIDNLKKEQKAARAARAKLSKDLRNAEKRRKRLKGKAKMLSETDLKEVLGMRATETTLKQVAASAKAQATTAANPSPGKAKKEKQLK